MGLVVNSRQMLKIKVGVNLRGGNVAVAQELLNAAQVTGRFQHVCSIRMSQHMRMQAVIAKLLGSDAFEAILDRSR